MTESEIKLVKRLWESGKTIGEIARLLPYKEYIAKQEIAKLKKSGVISGWSGKSQAKTQAKILELYNMGIKNPYEIAEIIGDLKASTVNQILSNLKVKKGRPKKNYKKRKSIDFNTLCDKTKEILDDLKSGVSVRQIATKHQVATQWVYAIKRKYVKGGKL